MPVAVGFRLFGEDRAWIPESNSGMALDFCLWEGFLWMDERLNSGNFFGVRACLASSFLL